MNKKFKVLFFLILSCFVSFELQAQAKLTIENNSQRTMTVKVMKGVRKGVLHKKVIIQSYGRETIYFSQSGYYFTKTKAVLNGKEPVYEKGKGFQVTNDATGYSVMTLTFSIKETAVPQVNGERISKSEFDQD